MPAKAVRKPRAAAGARRAPGRSSARRKAVPPVREEPLFVEAGPANWEATIVAFIQRHVAVAHAKGVVVGVSGGLDSAVIAALCVRALGKSKVHALLLPADDSDPRDERHGRLLCAHLGLKPRRLGIGPVVTGVVATLGKGVSERTLGNSKSRARMLVLYAYGQDRGLLVCGTGNKSELLTGYFTKWGDGAADLLPIGDLYKTQVRQLARHLGVPRILITKPPTAGLRPGQTDEGDLGVSYDELDAVLRGIELNHDLATVARKSGVTPAKVARVHALVRGTEHKRRLPLIPKIGARTVGIDWRRPVHWDAS